MPEGNFDFKEYEEAPEKLDFGKKKDCPHCKKPIAHDATQCYFCGQDATPPAKSAWVVWTVVFLVLSILLFIILGR